jgi:hypothetical protein
MSNIFSHRFGCTIAQDMTIYFMEPLKTGKTLKNVPSECTKPIGEPFEPMHEELIQRLGWWNEDDKDPVFRMFVRIEVLEWKIDRWHYDDSKGLPDWIGVWDEEIRYRVSELMEKMRPLMVVYQDAWNASGYDKQKVTDLVDELRKFTSRHVVFVGPDYKP